MKDNKIHISLPIGLPMTDNQIDKCIDEILERVKSSKANTVSLIFPSKSFRVQGFPSMEYFETSAKRFRIIRDKLATHNIDCGWFMSLTIKSGKTKGFEPIIRADGSEAPFSSCPLDDNFRQAFCKAVALVANIAKPAFILLEDDFSVHASSPKGCFCPLHLKGFAKVCGKEYDRETLVKLLEGKSKKNLTLLKKWREFAGESLVEFAKQLRKEVDKLSPEVPMGCNQTGADKKDGASSVAIAKALAGKRHKPIMRPHGTFYCGGESKDIPAIMFNAMKTVQDNKGKIEFLHESDDYPHNLFFTGASQMRAINSSAISYGEDGLLMFDQSAKIIIGVDCQENLYGLEYAKYSERFNAISKIVKTCEIEGVELCYDWFYNSLDGGNPLWSRALGLFGVPVTSKKSSVAFWDKTQATYYTDSKIKKYLSKTLFLDGDAAKILCERGYGKYLGISVGENLSKTPFTYDLGVTETITPEFSDGGICDMPCAHCFCNGYNGVMYEIIPNDKDCKVVTSYHQYGNRVCDTMTYFTNTLGGKVIVSGLTLYGNLSQALYNYPRQKLIQRLIAKADDKFITATNKPNLWLIVNKPKKSKAFKRLITINNLGLDATNGFTLRVPKCLGGVKNVKVLCENGRWRDADYSLDGELVKIDLTVGALDVEFIKII